MYLWDSPCYINEKQSKPEGILPQYPHTSPPLYTVATNSRGVTPLHLLKA